MPLYSIHNGQSYEDAESFVLEHDETFTDEQLDERIADAVKVAVAKAVRRDTKWLNEWPEPTTRQRFMEENDLDRYWVSTTEEAVLDVLTKQFGFRWPEYAAATTMKPETHGKEFHRRERSEPNE